MLFSLPSTSLFEPGSLPEPGAHLFDWTGWTVSQGPACLYLPTLDAGAAVVWCWLHYVGARDWIQVLMLDSWYSIS